MKIAVVGCGAVGSYYGACLWRAGQDVHFLLRSDFEVVLQRGVQIRSPNGDFLARPGTARIPAEIGVVDLVMVALKTTANDQLAALITPLVGPHTTILTLQNGLGNEEQLAGLFGPQRILGGMCFVCINRLAPGLVAHLAHGRIVMGEFQHRPLPRTHALAALFQRAGVPCDISENLERAHWEKLVWNVPFNGLGVAGAAGYEALIDSRAAIDLQRLGPVLPTDRLLGEARWEKLVRELMDEIITVANAKGLNVDPAAATEQVERTRGMGAYRASTLIDFERGFPLELESLFLRPLEHAKRVGVSTPRLEALCRVLTCIDPATRRMDSVNSGA